MALIDKDKKQEAEKLEYNTSNTAEPKKLNGVDDKTTKTINSTFTASDSQKQLDTNTSNALTNLGNLTNKNSLVSKETYDILGSSFQKPSSVVAADKWIANQLGIIQSGKTSWSDEVSGMMEKIANREKFSYDVDSDPLFQQALASSMNSGKIAMQDTIGQASALTGGYGSTYATTAGNQAYNSFIEDAYNNLPQYYQMAMEAYQMEGDELYRQLGMYTDADDREYNRNVTAYDATYQHRNQMYNEAYQQFRDTKTDALNMANLQLSEHGQLVSDAYNYYNASSNYSDSMYNREYNSWLDTVNQAFKNAELLNSDYWSQMDFNEDQRQFNLNLQEEQRQYNATYEQNDRHHSEEMTYKNNTLAEDRRQFNVSHGDTDGNGVLSQEEIAAFNAQEAKKKGDNTLTTTEINGIQKAYSEAGGGEKGYDAVTNYLKGLGITVDSEIIDSYIGTASAEKGLPAYYQTWTISKDTTNHDNPLKAGNEDMNDKYTNLNGETMTYKELKEAVNSSNLTEEEKKAFLKSLREQGKK